MPYRQTYFPNLIHDLKNHYNFYRRISFFNGVDGDKIPITNNHPTAEDYSTNSIDGFNRDLFSGAVMFLYSWFSTIQKRAEIRRINKWPIIPFFTFVAVKINPNKIIDKKTVVIPNGF